MFEVGEEVEYLGEELGKYRAVVVQSSHFYTTCAFYSLGKGGDPIGKRYGEHTFSNDKFAKKEPPLTKEQKVLKKIKYLEEQFAKRQAQKAKEKENASKNLSLQNEQYFIPRHFFNNEYITSERSRTISPPTW